MKPEVDALFEESYRFTVEAALKNRELVNNWERLSGHRLPGRRTPIEDMVDEACGLTETAWTAFLRFVRDYIWLPWLKGQIAEQQQSQRGNQHDDGKSERKGRKTRSRRATKNAS